MVGPAARAGLDVTALGGSTPAQAWSTHWTRGLSNRGGKPD